MSSNICIIGAGSFGTALAVMADKYGNKVTIWSPFEQEVDLLNAERENKRLLPGVKISDSIIITTDKASAFSDKELIIIATPSVAVRPTAQTLASFINSDTIISCVAKGLEAETHKTLDTIIEEELPNNPIVIISGPSHAEEVSRGVATTVVAASKDLAMAEKVQDILMNESFRIYVSDDVLGVEFGGALKNVIALSAGALDGLGAGDNTKAALMTRGIAEITRLGVAMGGKPETFGGLSGIGDLIVTCSSMHSRNRRCGILIGKGVPPEEAIEQIGMVVEGFTCAKAAFELAKNRGISMPITEETYQVLYEGKDIKNAIGNLMARPKRHEAESFWLNPVD